MPRPGSAGSRACPYRRPRKRSSSPKETGRADERSRVAAVFMNRLKKGMRLQSDPTVIYGIAGGQGTLGRPITRADLDQKTTHNTYQINGLPPTPICNPGRSAVEATLNPAATKDLYFVADGTGGHTFSDTLKEHNAAVSTWRKVERERKKEVDADSPGAIPVPSAAPPPRRS
ncbi:MAG: endolytic transglycosylase MltG [Hyphomicrobium sp.]